MRLPGRIPGTKPFWFFRLSATSSVLNGHFAGVEVRKEHDHAREKQQVQRLAGAKICEQRGHHRSGRFATRERRQRRGEQEKRRGEDRRNNASWVHLNRQVAGPAIKHLHTDLTARILDVDFAQAAFHEDHKGKDKR